MPERENRPKAISDKAKMLITEYSLQYANQHREIVANILRREIRKLGERPPKQETLKKAISKARNQQGSSLDKPWHLHETLDMPSDALSAIFTVKKWLENPKNKSEISSIASWTERLTNGTMATPNVLTIREAQWIARLYKIEPDQLSRPDSPHRLYQAIRSPRGEDYRLIANPNLLWYTAKAYADYERLCKIAEVDFNTSRLDEAILHGSIGATKLDLFESIKGEVENERAHNKAD